MYVVHVSPLVVFPCFSFLINFLYLFDFDHVVSNFYTYFLKFFLIMLFSYRLVNIYAICIYTKYFCYRLLIYTDFLIGSSVFFFFKESTMHVTLWQ